MHFFNSTKLKFLKKFGVIVFFYEPRKVQQQILVFEMKIGLVWFRAQTENYRSESQFWELFTASRRCSIRQIYGILHYTGNTDVAFVRSMGYYIIQVIQM